MASKDSWTGHLHHIELCVPDLSLADPRGLVTRAAGVSAVPLSFAALATLSYGAKIPVEVVPVGVERSVPPAPCDRARGPFGCRSWSWCARCVHRRRLFGDAGYLGVRDALGIGAVKRVGQHPPPVSRCGRRRLVMGFGARYTWLAWRPRPHFGPDFTRAARASVPLHSSIGSAAMPSQPRVTMVTSS